MDIVTGIVVFVIIWWLVLFTILPWGIRSQTENEIETGEEIEPGTEPGAPVSHHLGYKILITTGITIILWLVARMVIPQIMPQ